MRQEKDFFRHFCQRRRHKLKASILISTIIIACLAFILLFDSFDLTNNDIDYSTDRDKASRLEKDMELDIVSSIYNTDFKNEISNFLYERINLPIQNIYIFNRDFQFVNKDFSVSLLGTNTERPDEAILCIEKKEEREDVKRKFQCFCNFYDKRYQIENGLIVIDNKEDKSFFIDGALDGIYEHAKTFDRNILDLFYAEELRYKRSCSRNYQVEVYNGCKIPFVTNTNKPELIVLNNIDKENKMDLVFERNDILSGVRGLIAINGDLIVEGDTRFNGIIIMNGGDIIVKEGRRLIVSGLVISTKEIEESKNLRIYYNHEYLIKYGLLIPNFVDINLFCMRNGGI
ncbi:MAG: hypothetical protein GX219_04785 [Tissierellia bacterium]|nr:hypothetical protein [Tissierellia bacterium]